MKNLFDQQTYEETRQRVQQLTPESTPLWGQMTVAQMLHHCQFPFKIALSDEPRKRSWNPLFLLFKKSLINDKPFRKNLPTSKQLKVTEKKDFEKEQRILLDLVDSFYKKRDQKAWQPHPLFGHFTPREWGRLEFKHLDHHLTQFGV
ncbi:DUF1569 domain-containing protein [Croceiramulus getboli]|nr:DUF1569 domain-containing protein [Flavobacteriaceae bacterium YJPT1-3]